MPMGKKHARQWRIVVVESKDKLTSNPTATLGFFNGVPGGVTVDKAQVDKWIKLGAVPTSSVSKLLGL